MNQRCIMPEEPYCPGCPYGREVIPEWCETYDDLYYADVRWLCTLQDAMEGCDEIN